MAERNEPVSEDKADTYYNTFWQGKHSAKFIAMRNVGSPRNWINLYAGNFNNDKNKKNE